MKNKKIQKLICIALVGVSLVSLAGCGKKGEEKQKILTDVSFPLEESASLKVMTKAAAISTQNPEEKLIFQRIKEKTNVDIDWTCYVEDQFVDKRNLALAKKDSLCNKRIHLDHSSTLYAVKNEMPVFPLFLLLFQLFLHIFLPYTTSDLS